MEQRSKRRRLSQQEEPLVGYFESKHGPWPQLHHGIVVGERSRGHHEHLRKGAPNPLRITSGSSLTSNKSRPAGYATTHGDRSLPKVAPRGLGQDRSPEPPLRTAIASMVQVVVDLPDKSLTKLLVPPGSSIIPLQGYGTLTLDMGPSPSLPLPSQTISAIISSSANSPSPSAYPASSSMHPPNPFVHSASSAQQSSSQASRASIPEVSKTAIEPSYSITIAKSSPSSSPSLKINLPKPDSQIVLISPPSTPIPSNPPSSLLSDSADLFHFTSPVISSSSSYSSSRGTQSSSLLTSSQTIQPTHFMVSANGDTSSSISPPISSSTSAGKSTQISGTSNTANESTSISIRSSATKRSRTLATSLSSIRSQSHTSFKTSRTKSPTSSSITSTSKLQSSSSSSLVPTTSGVIIGGVGGSGEPAGTINASPPSETPQSGGGSGGNSTRVSPPTVIGGVVGGVAGLTIFFLVAFLLFYRRRNRQRRNLGSQPQATPLPPGSAGHDMTTTERSSTAPLAAAAFLKRLRPQSGQTAATTDTAPSERGFQNLGGRKLESVLSSRGDGYSEPGFSPGMGPASSPSAGPSSGPRRPRGFGHSPGPSEPETISRSSLYRDSQGFHGGNDGDPPSSSNLRPGSNTTTSMAIYPNPPESGLPPEGLGGFGSGDHEIAIMRPSPARTPVTGGFVPPPRSPRPMPSPRSPGTPISRGHRDGLGRSHPSFDGSRGSRFTEDM